MDRDTREVDQTSEQPSTGERRGGITQPELILQVPEADPVLGPFPEKVSLAVLPPLEDL